MNSLSAIDTAKLGVLPPLFFLFGSIILVILAFNALQAEEDKQENNKNEMLMQIEQVQEQLQKAKCKL